MSEGANLEYNVKANIMRMTTMKGEIEIVQPEFALMADSEYMDARVWHIYCAGGWAILNCGGMNIEAAEKSFCSRPKTSFFSRYPIPSSPEVLRYGFETTNFSGFLIDKTSNGRLVYFRASSSSPAWPYFSDPSDHFLAQLKIYNDLHSK